MTVPRSHTTDPDVSHGLLLGLLRSLGGSAEIDREHYAAGCTNDAGAWHGVTMEPIDGTGRIRLEIVEIPDRGES